VRGKRLPVAPRASAGRPVRFDFAFGPRLRFASRLFGVAPANARVEVDAHDLAVRFGRWTLKTPVANVADVTVTGPYSWWKVAGPPRLSLVDRGITFATTSTRGLCMSFRDPVCGLLPTAALRHPAATVTVADPDGLAAALREGQPGLEEP
jgi:hypothetical protein